MFSTIEKHLLSKLLLKQRSFFSCEKRLKHDTTNLSLYATLQLSVHRHKVILKKKYRYQYLRTTVGLVQRCHGNTAELGLLEVRVT